jgi:ribonuclease P protein component
MISRNNRFHGRASIQRLYKNGKMVRFGSLSMRFAPNSHRDQYRLAVVVSRKVSKSAVVRNRIRRRVYENVRILSTSFDTPYDLVIVAYDESLAELPAEKLRTDVIKLLNKAEVVSSSPLAHGIVEHKK